MWTHELLVEQPSPACSADWQEAVSMGCTRVRTHALRTLTHLGQQAVQRLNRQAPLLLLPLLPLAVAAAAAALCLLLVQALQDLSHAPLLVLPSANATQL